MIHKLKKAAILSQIKQILYPEFDRIPRLPIKTWHDELSLKFDAILKNNISLVLLKEDIYILVNQLSLICFYTSRISDAYQLCQNAIDLFYPFCLKKKHSNQAGLFQALINIIRLDRLTSNFEETIEKLRGINPYLQNRKHFIIGKYIFPTELVSVASMALIKNCFFDETIKLLIRHSKYNELFDFVKSSQQYIEQHQKPLANEALTIALNFTEGAEAAIEESLKISKNVNPSFIPVFNLKIAQYFLELENKEKAKSYLLPLYFSFKNSIQKCNLTGLRFCSSLAKTMIKCSLVEEAFLIVDQIINKYKIINDELSIIEILYSVRDYKKYKSVFENSMHNTQYLFLKDNSSNRKNIDLSLVNKLMSFLQRTVEDKNTL